VITDADRLARLTDSAPPIAAEAVIVAPPLRRICAWCPDFDPTAATNKGATHGICPDCYERERARERGAA
jgi:hypothetical protein